jgi:signal transduction histidine kinase/ActR/RegA family two-component response regulator
VTIEVISLSLPNFYRERHRITAGVSFGSGDLSVNLRLKSFLLVAAALLGTIIAMLAGVYLVSSYALEHIENEEAMRTAKRVKNLLMADAEELGKWVRDYATWNELALAVEQKDLPGIENLLSPEAAANAGWSFFVAFATDGTPVIASSLAPNSAARGALSDALLASLKTIDVQFSGAGQGRFTHHFGLLEGRPALLALGPVRTGNEIRRTVGTLVAGRWLTTREVERLSALADASAQLLPLATLEQSRAAHPGAPASDGEFFVERSASDGIAGGALLSDWNGKHVAMLRVEYRSHLREQGLRFVRVLMVVLVAGAVLLCALIDWLVLGKLIRRLATLSGSLHGIQRSGSLAGRLESDGNDEIAALAAETNRLLASAEQSHCALEKANAEMQQRVAERTTALAEANAALEADIAERIKAEHEREQLREQLLQAHKMEAVGTLAGGIAHDFNNILTGILGHAQLIAIDLPPGSSAAANLKQVVAAADRASSLVKQILAFSRQTPGERRLVSVSQVSREALALLRAALPAGISIRFTSDVKDDVVNADATQLHQVLMNLGANAGHAMGAKGGELDVRLERMQLRVPHPRLSPGEYLRISVRDTGCGMTQEVMDRIFDPFFSTKPVNEGTGLGLAVVHGIVADHGGAIDVESKIGVGTCFRVWLPVAGERVPTPTVDSAAPMGGCERVLLVDDEEIVRSVLSKGLQRLGYVVVAEASGQVALDRFREQPDAFDLVITDQTMPKMSGLQLTAALKAIRDDVPVILATGYSPDVAGREASTFGLAGIIGKPIHFSELTRIMRFALASTHRAETLSLR